MSDAHRMLVLGLGNPDRGDDAVGRRIARRLRLRQCHAPPASWLRRIVIAEHGGEAADLLTCLEGAAFALLVDACRLGGKPGTVHRFDASAAPLPRAVHTSTHALGLASALELARALGQLPERCIVYAVEAQRLAPGAPLSHAVARVLDPLEQRLIAELAPGFPGRPDAVNAACSGAFSLAGAPCAPRAGDVRDGLVADPAFIGVRLSAGGAASRRLRPDGAAPRSRRRR